MCGFVGYFSKKRKDQNVDLISKMTFTLKHRGPDNMDIYYCNNNNLYLGHTRLSIIDLNRAGNQPFESVCKRYLIVYNGEIYNYLKLKQILNEKFNIIWTSNTDTEVLINLIKFFGITQTLEMIEGMFSFVFYDKKLSKLILARDSFGQKPLYYGYSNEKFYFSSELKAIKYDKNFDKVINKESVYQLMNLNYIPAPLSIYKNIFKLKPQHYLELNIKNDSYDNSLLIPIKYNLNISFKDKNINFNTNNDFDSQKNNLKDLLFDSISQQMIADVDTGSFLSSGVDSTLISSIMQKISSKKINTFSLGYEKKEYDESEDAKKISEYIGTNHHSCYLDSKSSLEIINKLSTIYCEPFSDSSQIPTYFLSNFTSQYNKVVLSGDGGDELFGGYNRYIHADRIEKLYKYPPYIKRFLLKFIQNLKFLETTLENNQNFFSSKFKIKNFYRNLNKMFESINSENPSDLYLKLISHWGSINIVKNYSTNINYIDDYWNDDKTFRDNFMSLDLKYYLPDDILVKTDRASMANSLEVRSPFLDNNIYQYSKHISNEFKVNSSGGKIILKSILDDYVPNNLRANKKRGFLIPIKEWLNEGLKDWSDSLIYSKSLKENGIFDHNKIYEVWESFKKNHNNNEYLIWDVLMFQSWYENNF